MPRGLVTRGDNLTKNTLLQIAATGAIVVIAASSPYFFHRVAREYFKDNTPKAMRDRARKLRELRREEIVLFRHLPNNDVRIELTKKGDTIIRQYNLEAMRLKRPKRWDGKWHLVMYDIPHQKKPARDALRQKLRQMGLYQLQKSVWLTPYECRDEIEFLCDVFELDFDDYFHYLSLPSAPREEEMKKLFNL